MKWNSSSTTDLSPRFLTIPGIAKHLHKSSAPVEVRPCNATGDPCERGPVFQMEAGAIPSTCVLAPLALRVPALLAAKTEVEYPMRNFTISDIVLVVDEKFPWGSWPLGRVLEVYPNKHDGHVRRVKANTMKSILERPVDMIVLLELAMPVADK